VSIDLDALAHPGLHNAGVQQGMIGIGVGHQGLWFIVGDYSVFLLLGQLSATTSSSSVEQQPNHGYEQ